MKEMYKEIEAKEGSRQANYRLKREKDEVILDLKLWC